MDARRGSLNAHDAVPERPVAAAGPLADRAVARVREARMASAWRVAPFLPVLLLALWQYASTAGFSIRASCLRLPPCLAPGGSGYSGRARSWRGTPALGSNTSISAAWRVLVGFAIASAVGISVGVLIGWFELMRRSARPDRARAASNSHDGLAAIRDLHFRHSRGRRHFPDRHGLVLSDRGELHDWRGTDTEEPGPRRVDARHAAAQAAHARRAAVGAARISSTGFGSGSASLGCWLSCRRCSQ